MRSFVALGSNLGDKRGYLRMAVEFLPGVVAVSPVYETEPVGGPSGQDAYLNCVVELDTDIPPRELFEICIDIERGAGRERRERWGPRTLDIDILLYGDMVVDEPDLHIPHKRMYERRFVLAPLRDLAPDLVTPEQVEAAMGEVTSAGAL